MPSSIICPLPLRHDQRRQCTSSGKRDDDHHHNGPGNSRVRKLGLAMAYRNDNRIAVDNDDGRLLRRAKEQREGSACCMLWLVTDWGMRKSLGRQAEPKKVWPIAHKIKTKGKRRTGGESEIHDVVKNGEIGMIWGGLFSTHETRTRIDLSGN